MPKKVQIEPVPGEKCFHYYPQLVVVVGVCVDDKINFMPCAWNTCLSYDPYLYGVSVGQTRFTHGMLQQADVFTVNFLGLEHCHLVRALGRSTGSEIDKAKEFNVGHSNGVRIDAPVMDTAYYSLECIKRATNTYGDHTLFVGEVQLMHLSDSITNDKNIDTDLISPLLYLGVDHYITTDKTSRFSLKNLPLHYRTQQDR